MIPVKVELQADTDKAMRQIEGAFKKVKGSIDTSSIAGKKFVDEANKIGPAFEAAAPKALKFMEAVSKVNAIIAIGKKAMDWGDEFVKSGKATKEQIEDWKRVKEIVGGIKDILGEIVVTVASITGPLAELGDYFFGPKDENSSAAEIAARHARRKAQLDAAIKSDEDWYYSSGAYQSRLDTSAEDAKLLAIAQKAEEEALALDASRAGRMAKEEADWRRRMAKVLEFKRQYAEAQNDPRLKNARIDSILGGEPSGNLDGIISDADAEDARREERNRLATEDAQAAYKAAQINAQANEAEVEGIRSKISAAVEFMKMDRARKVQWLKDTGTEEAIKAGAYLGEALFFTATGNPAAAGLYAAAAQHAAVAAACGVGAAAMGGGGGRGAATGAAGGGYSSPSRSSSGGAVTYIVNVSGVVGDKEDVGAYVAGALKKAHAQGRIVSGDSAAEFD